MPTSRTLKRKHPKFATVKSAAKKRYNSSSSKGVTAATRASKKPMIKRGVHRGKR